MTPIYDLAEMLEYQTKVLDADGSIAMAAVLKKEANHLRILAELEQQLFVPKPPLKD